jgi:hypothetical protein
MVRERQVDGEGAALDRWQGAAGRWRIGEEVATTPDLGWEGMRTAACSRGRAHFEKRYGERRGLAGGFLKNAPTSRESSDGDPTVLFGVFIVSTSGLVFT